MRRRLNTQLRRYGRHYALLVLLMVAGTAAGFYILVQQRLPDPFKRYYFVNTAFPTAAGVVPGLGEPVNVSGVHVGQISGTTVRDGVAIVRLQIDPSKVVHLYGNATAELVPNTPLEDMQVDLDPGDPAAGVLPNNATIQAGQTLSPIASDELLDSLDTDTRTWMASLITDVGVGTAGRGADIRGLLRALGPTATQFRQIGDLLAARRLELAQIVHNLGALTTAASRKNAQIGTFVRAADATVAALANQDQAIETSVARLPATLASAHKTLDDLTPFAGAVGASATALLPSARRLPQTLSDSQTVLRGVALVPTDQLHPLVSAVLPLAQQLAPLTTDLRAEVPALTNAFKVLTYSTNELAYNPSSRHPGFLHWFAWFAHNLNSFASVADANGPAWRTLVLTTCPILSSSLAGQLIADALGTTFGCQ